jgi:eukaryotic-like serine/threonine-protein kinase
MEVEQRPTKDHEPVDLLAEEFLARYRRGERPSITEYVTQHPDLAEEIREIFPTLAVLERLGPRPDELSGRPLAAISGVMPRQLGEYQLVREVGRGGMGIVYEAEQLSLGRRVALKVLPAHAVLSSSLLTRFQNEAKAAARLHHTNIVPVFGVGEDQGLHYYAMQFIQGQGLDAVLGELRRLRKGGTALDPKELFEPSAQRLDQQQSEILAKSLVLGRFADQPAEAAGDGQPHPPESELAPGVQSGTFDKLSQSAAGDLSSQSTSDSSYFRSVARMGLQVAEALAHAHSQGVLHRDIKPSNLLLDALGCVWVTDFGLAKQEGSDLTRSGDVVGTLRYLAPERFRGMSDARTDIYGLGVTLYELLTIKPAFSATDRARLVHDIVEKEPAPPRRLAPQLPRDLETIVLKAITKDPAQRYATAAEMAADLRRFLEDQPIGARRTGLIERAWRWCVRRPALAGLAAALVLSVAGGLGGVFWQWGRAKINLHEAVRQKGLAENSLAVAQSETARAEKNLQEAGHQRSIAEQEAQRAEANYQTARHAVDELLTMVSEDELKKPGLQSLRLRLLTRAREYYQGMLQQRADDPKARADLAASYLNVARIKRLTGPAAESRESYRKAIEILEQISGDRSDSEGRLRLVQAYNELALLQINDHDFAAAEQGLQRARQLITQFVERTPDKATGEVSLAMTLINVAWCISQSPSRESRARLEEALQVYQQALDIFRRLATEQPGNYDIQRGLSIALSNMGNRNRELRRFDEARRLFEECLQIREDLLHRKPDSLDMRSLLAATYNSLGDVILRSPTLSDSAFAEAIVHYEKSLEMQEQLARENPAVFVYRDDVDGTLRNLSELYARRADWERAVEFRRRANAMLESNLDQDDANLRLRANWAGSMVVQAEYEHQLGRYTEALASQKRARETWRRIEEQPDLLQEYRDVVIRNLSGLIRVLGFLERPADIYSIAQEQRELCQDRPAALLALAFTIDQAVRAATRGAELDDEGQAAVQRCLDLAIDLFQQGVKSDPSKLKAFIRSHPQMADYETLLTLCETLQKDEGDARALVHRSTALRHLGHISRADLDTSRAANLLDAKLKQFPKNAYALYWRATLHFRAGHWQEAARDCTPFLEIRPSDAPILRGRAAAAAHLGRWQQSWEDYDRLVAIDSKNGAYLHLRCRAAHELGWDEEVPKDLLRLRELEGQDGVKANAVAWRFLSEGDMARFPEDALWFAQRAVELDPRPDHQITRGGIDCALGRYREAASTLAPAADKATGGNGAFANFWLAICHHHLGDSEKSQEFYRRALKSWKEAGGITASREAFLLAVWQEVKALIRGSENQPPRS